MFREPEDHWEPWQSVEVVLLGGPDRVSVDEEPDTEFRPRPVGFVLPKRETEPMTREGDNA